MDELPSGGAELLDDLGRSQGSVINSNLVVDRLSPGARSPGLPGSGTTRRKFLSQHEAA
jgi:hypothetical protein